MPESNPPRLLKARRHGGGQGVAFNFEDLRGRCEAEIDRARKEAAEILEQAQRESRKEAEAALERAKRDGYEQGLRDADAEVQRRATELANAWVDERLQTALPAMRAVGEALKDERERWLSKWESGVIQLAVAVAEKLVRRTLELQPEVAGELIRETLQLAAGNNRVHVRLHPADYEQLSDFRESVAGSLANMSDVALHADESISRGGCLVQPNTAASTPESKPSSTESCRNSPANQRVDG
jgi:flagellar assembly protein FliH